MIQVEDLLYGFYIKYDKLKELINDSFKGSNANKINVVIDLYSIFKSLYRSDIIVGDVGSIITSSIINMVAHYKNFFKVYYQTDATFYLINSINSSISNIAYYKSYNKKYRDLIQYNKLITDLIKNNVELIDILCNHIPDIYYISTSYETGCAICMIQTLNVPTICITKDQYLYQLCGTLNDFTILRPRKGKNGDESYYVNRHNLMKIYLLENDNKYIDSISKIDSSLLSTIMALTSLPCRDVKKLYTRPTAISILNKAIENHYINNAHSVDIKSGLSKLIDNEDLFIFDLRYKAIDIISQYILNSDKLKLEIKIKPYIHDPITLQHLNNNYFVKNPLDLNRL